jgi:hypothetical protein
MFPITYDLSKDAALVILDKITHPLDSPCSSPWCPCSTSQRKAEVMAVEVFNRNNDIRIGRETYYLPFISMN